MSISGITVSHIWFDETIGFREDTVYPHDFYVIPIAPRKELVDYLSPARKAIAHEYDIYFTDYELANCSLVELQAMLVDRLIKEAIQLYGSDYPVELLYDRALPAPERRSKPVHRKKKLGSFYGGRYRKNARIYKNM